MTDPYYWCLSCITVAHDGYTGEVIRLTPEQAAIVEGASSFEEALRALRHVVPGRAVRARFIKKVPIQGDFWAAIIAAFTLNSGVIFEGPQLRVAA